MQPGRFNIVSYGGANCNTIDTKIKTEKKGKKVEKIQKNAAWQL